MAHIGRLRAAPASTPTLTKGGDGVQITVRNSDLNKLSSKLTKDQIDHVQTCKGASNDHVSVIHLSMADTWFLKAMLKFKMGPSDLKSLKYYLDTEPTYQTVIGDLEQLTAAINRLGKNGRFNAEILLNGRW